MNIINSTIDHMLHANTHGDGFIQYIKNNSGNDDNIRKRIYILSSIINLSSSNYLASTIDPKIPIDLVTPNQGSTAPKLSLSSPKQLANMSPSNWKTLPNTLELEPKKSPKYKPSNEEIIENHEVVYDLPFLCEEDANQTQKQLTLLHLNEDVLDEIMAYLPARTLAAISCVSKTIQQTVKTRVTRALNLNYIERILRPVYSKSVFVNDLHFLSYVENGFCNPAISCGFEHTAFVSKHGNVFTWGSGNDGRLGHGDFKDKTSPTKVNGLKNIFSVSCGHSHTNALTKNGKVYCFGEGQLKPVLIEGALKNKFVTKVSSGNNMSVFVTKDNEIYVSGRGLVLQEDQQAPKVSTNPSSESEPETPNVFTPRKIQLGDINVDNNTAIVQIATGARHLLILNSKGEVFSCGFGGAGQLGHDDLDDRLVPKRVTGLSKPVVFISAGQFHSVAVTSSGELYTFGLSNNGRLGHRRAPANREGRNALPVIAVPQRVELPSKAIMAAAGYSHTLVLTADNNVLSFGDSSFGQLGNDSNFFDSPDQFSKFAVSLSKSDRFTQVCAGGQHSCVLTEQGEIFVAGNGSLLGLGDSMRQTFRVSRPRMMSINDEDPGSWKSRKDVGLFASIYSSSRKRLLPRKLLGNLKFKVSLRERRMKRSQSFS